MPPYQIFITGNGLKSLTLEFEDSGKSRVWKQQVTKIRSKTTIILKQKYKESQNISIQYTYLHSSKNLFKSGASTLSHLKSSLI